MVFRSNKEKSKISICIPVYNAEKTLQRALESVVSQSFTDWEIIVVNDGSPGRDESGRDCHKILTQFRKSHKIPGKRVIYREHRTNLGLLEARRTAVEASNTDYIFMLDSDDELLPQALQTLYEAAVQTGADIVHGGAEVIARENASDSIIQKRVAEMHKKANNIYAGQLTGQDIFDGFLVQNNHTGFLWAKLIKKDTYQAALFHIPFSNCVFAEDFLQYFFISYEAQKYLGINQSLYRYYVDDGISSFQKITDLERWKKICSTANVFTILFQVVKELPSYRYSEQEKQALQQQSCSYLANNIKQLQEAVLPDLQPAAKELLCEYWGKDFVELMLEKQSEKSEKNHQK